MFGLFKKDPVKILQKKYENLMSQAMQVQRSGDLKHYARIIEEADDIQNQIEELEKKNAK